MSLVILVYRWAELEKLISKIVRTTFRWQKKYVAPNGVKLVFLINNNRKTYAE